MTVETQWRVKDDDGGGSVGDNVLLEEEEVKGNIEKGSKGKELAS